MEADLHNLYPARADVNRARSNYIFGVIEGESREFDSCDFEYDKELKKRRATTCRMGKHCC